MAGVPRPLRGAAAAPAGGLQLVWLRRGESSATRARLRRLRTPVAVARGLTRRPWRRRWLAATARPPCPRPPPAGRGAGPRGPRRAAGGVRVRARAGGGGRRGVVGAGGRLAGVAAGGAPGHRRRLPPALGGRGGHHLPAGAGGRGGAGAGGQGAGRGGRALRAAVRAGAGSAGAAGRAGAGGGGHRRLRLRRLPAARAAADPGRHAEVGGALRDADAVRAGVQRPRAEPLHRPAAGPPARAHARPRDDAARRRGLRRGERLRPRGAAGQRGGAGADGGAAGRGRAGLAGQAPVPLARGRGGGGGAGAAGDVRGDQVRPVRGGTAVRGRAGRLATQPPPPLRDPVAEPHDEEDGRSWRDQRVQDRLAPPGLAGPRVLAAPPLARHLRGAHPHALPASALEQRRGGAAALEGGAHGLAPRRRGDAGALGHRLDAAVHSHGCGELPRGVPQHQLGRRRQVVPRGEYIQWPEGRRTDYKEKCLVDADLAING